MAVLQLPLFPSIRTSGHTVRSTTPSSAHVLKAEACFRTCTEDVFSFHCICRIVPQIAGSPSDHMAGESENLNALHFRDGGYSPYPVVKSEFKQGKNPAVPLSPTHGKFNLL